MVEGHVPHRGGLLLHPRLPARHRRPGRRGAVTGRDHPAGPPHPVRRPADLPPGRGREPAWRGLDRDAGAAAAVVAGQAVRAGPARLRGHRLHHHHHPLGRRRHRPCPGEPAGPRRPGRPPGRRHAGVDRAAGRRLPQGVLRGHRDRGRAGGRLPGPQPRRRDRGPGAPGRQPGAGRGLAAAADHQLQQPAGHGRGRPDRLPETGPGPVGVRDRGGRDAPGPGRPPRHPRAPTGPDPQHPQAADDRGPDHERFPDHQQLRDHGAHPPPGVRGGRPGQRSRPRLPGP